MSVESIKKDVLDFWNNLIKYNVQIITHVYIFEKEGIPPSYIGPINFNLPEKYSYNEFYAFSMNISRIMHLYQELYRYSFIDFKQYFNFSSPYKSTLRDLKECIVAESIIILLISAIEAFLEDSFRKIARVIKIKPLDSQLLKKFLKLFNIDFKLKWYKKIPKETTLSSILPKNMDFQKSKNCKIAYKLINLDIPALNNSLWEYIFASKNTKSILSRRNSIIHDLTKSIERLNISRDIVKEDIEKTCEFIFNIEKTIIEKFRGKIQPDIYFF